MSKSAWRKAIGPASVGAIYGLAAVGIASGVDQMAGDRIEEFATNYANQTYEQYVQNGEAVPYHIEKFHKNPTLPFYLPIFFAAGLAGAYHWRKISDRDTGAKPESSL